ncbi:P-loop containing nucleoside triphosphate hydrolase protein [Lactarius deliciosus]|nr:P-loop containing nucleoside triphosphate hydrolase protein [Lactarius deliciosus]
MSLSHAVQRFPQVCRRVIQSASTTHFTTRSFASAVPHSSRTRLVKDLTPRPTTGHSRKSTRKLIEVAPRDASPTFEREAAPHSLKRDKNLHRGPLLSAGNRERRPRYREDAQNRRRVVRKDGIHAGTRQPPRQSWRDRDGRDRDTSAPRVAVQKATSDVAAEFDFSTAPEAPSTLPSTFASPPLSSGLLQSVRDILGPTARPTPIQALSLKHLFASPSADSHRRFLLASETGSGKSLAYLLPMLHDLKATEHLRTRCTGPRALVLSPTHELARQLAGFGKALVHHDRLRVQSASRANVASGTKARVSAAKMSNRFGGKDAEGEFEVRPGGGTGHTVDVLVGTPSKLLEMVRGNGWNKEFAEGEEERRRKWVVGRPEVSLSDVEWVVVDEADVLFDPDFIDQTLLLLSDVAAARGKPVPVISRAEPNPKPQASPVTPLDYPFNFVLTSATIPAALATHLDAHHPDTTRLVSPRLHRLPAHLALEFAPYTSGNRNAEVLAKLKAVWRDDALAGRRGGRSRVIIFTNTRARAGEMGAYLSDHGVPNVVVTGQGKAGSSGGGGGGARAHGSNKHLAGFLRPLPGQQADGGVNAAEAEAPRVLLSTSLLARGLDFDPSVSHVFVLEPPRNTADFLHRAGRTARAGGSGRVVVFGRGAGRGAGKVREMRQRIYALKSRR